MMEFVCIVPEGIDGKNRILDPADNDPHIPRVFVRGREKAVPIDRGRTFPGVDEQDRS